MDWMMPSRLRNSLRLTTFRLEWSEKMKVPFSKQRLPMARAASFRVSLDDWEFMIVERESNKDSSVMRIARLSAKSC